MSDSPCDNPNRLIPCGPPCTCGTRPVYIQSKLLYGNETKRGFPPNYQEPDDKVTRAYRTKTRTVTHASNSANTVDGFKWKDCTTSWSWTVVDQYDDTGNKVTTTYSGTCSQTNKSYNPDGSTYTNTISGSRQSDGRWIYSWDSSDGTSGSATSGGVPVTECYGLSWMTTTTETATSTTITRVGVSGIYESYTGSGTYSDTTTLSGEVSLSDLDSSAEQFINVCAFNDLVWNATNSGHWTAGPGANYYYAECGTPSRTTEPEWNDQMAPIAYNLVGVNNAATHLLPEQFDSESSVAKGKSAYRFVVKFNNEWCPGDGDYVVKWRERFDPQPNSDAPDPEPVYSDLKTLMISPSQATDKYYSPEYILEVPDQRGKTTLVGEVIKATLSLSIMQTLGCRIRKHGFLEYDRTGSPTTPAKVFARETASGSYPGCPATGAAGKTYSGNQHVTSSEYLIDTYGLDAGPLFLVDVYNGVPRLEKDFSGSVPAGRISPLWQNLTFALDQQADKPTQVTPQTRLWEAKSTCEENTLTDSHLMSLSEEVTTGSMVSLANQLAAAGWPSEDESGAITDPPVTFISGSGDSGSLAAESFLADDEMECCLRKLRFKLRAVIPAAFTEDKAFAFVYRVTERDLETGDQTVSTMVHSVTFEIGETVNISGYIELGVPGGNKIKSISIAAADQPEDDEFEGGIVAVTTNTPPEVQ